MRIAVNTRLLLKGKLEGIGWFTFQTLNRIVAAHPEHSFIFIFDRPYDASFVFADNVIPVVVPPPARHPILFYCWFEWSIPYVLKKYKADMFLSPDGIGSLRTQIPSVLVMHDLAFEHYPEHLKWSHSVFMRYYSKRYARHAQQLVTVSNFSKQDIVDRYHIDPAKISVACNGAHSAYQPLSWEQREQVKKEYAQGEEYFIFAGALHPRKNVVALLKAFVLFKKRNRTNMKLVVVGRLAWNYEEVEQMRDAMPFKEDVIWVGYSDVNQLCSIIGAAYAMVYPSLFEGFGIPILESYYCDVPAIVSTTSSMPEVGGDAALYVDPMDDQSIADAMTRMYKDELLRKQLIEKAKVHRTQFTWDKAADVLWQAMLKAVE